MRSVIGGMKVHRGFARRVGRDRKRRSFPADIWQKLKQVPAKPTNMGCFIHAIRWLHPPFSIYSSKS